MSFNPGISKQAQEVIFSRKLKKAPHPPLMFNSNLVNKASSQKHLGIIPDESLSFEEQLKTISVKTNKTLYLLRKLQNLLPRAALITLYKSLIRPYLDYGDIIYEQAFKSSFREKLESIQYNASLAITGAIRGTSREKLYNELGFESLHARRWYRKLCYLYKFYVFKQPEYLFNLIPVRTPNYRTRKTDDVPYFNIKHNFFKNSFFPSAVIEWNKLDSRLRKAKSFTDFKRNILSFIRPKANSIFNCNSSKGLKFFTRLRLGLSHLREHKFKHSFQDSINPLCSCSLDIESTIHSYLHCPQFTIERHTLLNTISQIDNKLLDSYESNLLQHLLFGDPSKDTETNTEILNATVNYVLTTRRFDEQLF